MARKPKTHFAMPWYRNGSGVVGVCGNMGKWSSVPTEVDCCYCRRYNLSERAKAKAPTVMT